MKNLITYEEARKTALEYDPALNESAEYSDAWFFYLNDGEFRVGGAHSGIVILKDGGKKLLGYEYFMSDKYECIDMDNVVQL